jgi:hypothetical protein
MMQDNAIYSAVARNYYVGDFSVKSTTVLDDYSIIVALLSCSLFGLRFHEAHMELLHDSRLWNPWQDFDRKRPF